MKKYYRIWDDCNDFTTIKNIEEEEILEFNNLLIKAFGDSSLRYEEIKPSNYSLKEEYSIYLKNDGFDEETIKLFEEVF